MDNQTVRHFTKWRKILLCLISFSYRLLDIPIRKDRNPLLWIRFDAFARQMIINHSSEEIYLM